MRGHLDQDLDTDQSQCSTLTKIKKMKNEKKPGKDPRLYPKKNSMG